MFRPVPSAFTGSMPAPPRPAPHGRAVELSFAGLAVASAASVWAAALWLGHAGDWRAVTLLMCIALLVPAALGLYVTKQVSTTTRATLAWMYDQVVARAEPGRTGAVQRPEAEDAGGSFVGLFGGLVVRHRRLQAGHARVCDAAASSTLALQAGRDQADRLAHRLRGDGATIADAASGIIAASARLQDETQDARAGAQRAAQRVDDLATHALGLAASVRAVTGQVVQMQEIAVGAADAAFDTQANLARLAGRAAELDRAAAQVNRAMRVPGRVGRPTGAADNVVSLAAMAEGAEQALDAMMTVIADLRTEAGHASRRVAELCAILHGQHELGTALSCAVEQQGDEITGVLAAIHAAEGDWDALRTSVEAIGASNDARLASAEELRGVADQVPSHAATIAGILRSIPDFAPPFEF